MASASRMFLQSARISARPALLRQQNSVLRSAFQRRFQSSVAGEAKETAQQTAEKSQSALQRLWNSPVGPKTVHFWAPIMKWGVVLAGVADFFRPAESLSLTQNAALLSTGAIWTRWCLIIKPKNYFLAAVNFFLFLVGTTQCARVIMYQQSQKDKTLGEELKDAAKEQGRIIEGVVKDPKGALERAEKA